jgi:hypothetical protein
LNKRAVKGGEEEMKKKIILGSTLTLSLLIISIVATTLPAFANNPQNSLTRKGYGTMGDIDLVIPSNATYPAKPGGATNHPTNIGFLALDADRRSTPGAFDQLTVYIWDPASQRETPVLAITDNPTQAEFLKTFWNNTYLWYPTPLPLQPILGPNMFPNVILVQPNELEIWTESSRTYNGWDHKGCYDTSETLWVNLTTPVKSTLTNFIINYSAPSGSPARSANVTFTLPPLTMFFRPLDDGFPREETFIAAGWPGASGYTQKIEYSEVSARVNVQIPSWLGTDFDFIGTTWDNFIAKTSPPQT